MVLQSYSLLRPLPFAFLMTLLSPHYLTCFNIDSMIISDPVAAVEFLPTDFSFPFPPSPPHSWGVLGGFAFVYMEDERDADDAIRRLDRIEFGKKGRRLRVEWTKEDRGGSRRPDSSRKPAANTKPSKTLFVINFDPVHTRTRDIERYFEPYGRISNVRIRRNFAFVQYESEDDASRALEATNMSKFMDRVISVEFAIRDDDDRRNGRSPDRRGRDMSPGRRGYVRRRSPSPYRRDRGSPDYGHGALLNSRPRTRGSPEYRRAESPVNERYHSRSPPPRERSRS
ncbi:serine/arginine-rich splicing factor RS41 isoform X1 [Nicotiana tabacum]|uniref:Serine/arginine-rich splicing factor RS41 isoform X1 n=1 Tax=Nicotiana tabacum TaxID=4097 RepID=A0A1S3X649_TOBAC|nr:serine/arginine-rich splicing factor RS41-like isoform X1 [Nicotiana tomentosiformis]XP_016435321.1 PREDICTED: serine/arginine-rich splicing factor RS41-like isoform X1 [Nicotiana tabacum]